MSALSSSGTGPSGSAVGTAWATAHTGLTPSRGTPLPSGPAMMLAISSRNSDAEGQRPPVGIRPHPIHGMHSDVGSGRFPLGVSGGYQGGHQGSSRGPAGAFEGRSWLSAVTFGSAGA